MVGERLEKEEAVAIHLHTARVTYVSASSSRPSAHLEHLGWRYLDTREPSGGTNMLALLVAAEVNRWFVHVAIRDGAEIVNVTLPQQPGPATSRGAERAPASTAEARGVSLPADYDPQVPLPVEYLESLANGGAQ